MKPQITKLFLELRAFIYVYIVVLTGVILSILVKALYLVKEYPGNNFLSPVFYALVLAIALEVLWHVCIFVLRNYDKFLIMLARFGVCILAVYTTNFIMGNSGLSIIEYAFAPDPTGRQLGPLAVIILLLWSAASVFVHKSVTES